MLVSLRTFPTSLIAIVGDLVGVITESKAELNEESMFIFYPSLIDGIYDYLELLFVCETEMPG